MMKRLLTLVFLITLLTSGFAAAQEEEGLTYLDDLQGSVITPAREIEDFTLESTTGEDFTLSEHGGEILLIYFGYMTCADVCPTTLADMLRAYREIGEPAEQVKMIFITFDPERDTLPRMTMYMQAFHEDFIGLRTDDPELLASLLDNFGVMTERRDLEDSSLGYVIDHSATTFVVGGDGKVIEQFPYGVPYTEISHDLMVLMEHMVAPDSDTETDNTPAEATQDEAREFRIVIPEGTGNQISMGNDPGIIPLNIELILGVRDVIVLENHDNSDFLVGGIWVAPFETVRKQFYEPQTFEGLCTVTVGRDLVEIIVREPTEEELAEITD